MKSSIFMRMLAATLVPSLLIISILVIVINNTVMNLATNNAVASARAFAVRVTDIMRVNIDLLTNELDFYAGDTADLLQTKEYKVPSGKEQMGDMLGRLLNKDAVCCAWFLLKQDDGTWFEYGLADETGEALPIEFGSIADMQDDESLQWLFKPFKTGEPFVTMCGGTDFRDAGIGENCEISSVYPVKIDGETVGCVGIKLNYHELIISAMGSNTDIQSKIAVLRSDGMAIFCDDGELAGNDFAGMLMKDDAEAASQLKAVLSEDTPGIVRYKSKFFEDESILCIAPMRYDFTEETSYLAAVVPLSAYLQGADASINLIIYGSVIGTILLVALIFFSARYFVLPIRRLIESSERIANGDLEVTFDIEENIEENEDGGNKDEYAEEVRHSRDELTQLALSLQQMMRQLRASSDLQVKALQSEIDKEKALATSDAKTRFFANASHEIRTPMNSILGIAQILLQDAGISDKQRKYLSDIKLSCDNLLNIINDVLDLSKLESGKMNLSPADYNFRQMMNEINAMVALLCEQKHLEYIYEVKGEEPQFLYGDAVRTRQVITNILGNAVKFTDKGTITLTLTVTEDKLRFEIADTGRGISEEHMPLLFEAFEQFDTEGKARGSGTGLGLPICKDLAEIMGGSVIAQSVYGEGSVFTVILPKVIGDGKKLRAQPKADDVYFTPDTKILVVDDNEINLHVASGLIDALFNLDCDVALSGMEAIKMVQNTDYDIVFMDHMMPDMDGVETTQRIRALGGKFEKQVIIALTANAVVGMKGVLMDAGMNDFLSKPIKKEELVDILDRWLPQSKHSVNKAGRIKSRQTAFYTEVIEQASKIVGLDVTVGLNNIAYKQDVYEKSLSILNSKIPEAAKQMPALLEKGNIKGFTIQIHGMKSSLASVGALDLSKLALKLEKAGNTGDEAYLRDTLPIFIQRLTKLGEQLQEIFGTNVSSEENRPHGTDELFLELMNQLKTALSTYSYDAVSDIASKLSALNFGEERNADIKQLLGFVEVFNYDGLHVIVEKYEK
jgi:signal transduction histidine kinase/DNA-binding NarL/FixJ family response regulator/HPt (histidine-containing phosphotransfer) domain-containing protein